MASGTVPADSCAHAVCGVEKPYLELPWHWTDQYEHNVQIIGRCGAELQWLQREDAEGRLSALGIDAEGRLQGAILLDNGREMTPLRRLIMGNRPVAREREMTPQSRSSSSALRIHNT